MEYRKIPVITKALGIYKDFFRGLIPEGAYTRYLKKFRNELI